jgi:hypothetical protein
MELREAVTKNLPAGRTLRTEPQAKKSKRTAVSAKLSTAGQALPRRFLRS